MSVAPIRVRRSDDSEAASDLDRTIFPGDVPLVIDPSMLLWLATHDDDPIGFCAASIVDRSTVYLARAGVLDAYRGRGLYRHMLRTLASEARRIGAECVVTYTATWNSASCNGLIGAGYRMYRPAWEWVGPDVLYWRAPVRKRVSA